MRTLVPAFIGLGVLAAALIFAGALVLAASTPVPDDPAPSEGCIFTARLEGVQEVPENFDTRAQGQFRLTPSSDGTEADFRLIVTNIENVVAAHLHLAPIGQDGPVVATLLGSLAPGGGPTRGPIARGTLTSTSLTGSLQGRPFSALIDAIKDGDVYVNVHTDDGVASTAAAPGDYPGGEIRGQVRAISHECAGPTLYYWVSCGDPLCFEFRDDPDIPACTTQQYGDPCYSNGEVCEVGNCENQVLVCARTNPFDFPCPISLARYKRDIKYLGEGDIRRLHDELLSYHLTTYQYRSQGAGGPERLGFLIDDVGTGPSVAPDGRTVDLYGYTSMAVAAIQEQSRVIEALTRKVEALERKIAAGERRAGGRRP